MTISSSPPFPAAAASAGPVVSSSYLVRSLAMRLHRSIRRSLCGFCMQVSERLCDLAVLLPLASYTTSTCIRVISIFYAYGLQCLLVDRSCSTHCWAGQACAQYSSTHMHMQMVDASKGPCHRQLATHRSLNRTATLVSEFGGSIMNSPSPSGTR